MNRRSVGWRLVVATIAYAVTTGVAASQSSSERVIADPAAHYPILKKVVAEMARDYAQQSQAADKKYLAELKQTNRKAWQQHQRELREERRRNATDLINCSTAAEFIPDEWLTERELTKPLASVANDFTFLEGVLAPFPRRIWEPLVRALEAKEVAGVIRDGDIDDGYFTRREAFMRQLASRLNRERKSNRSLPRLFVEGGCGAGEIGVQIATEPAGAQVLFIPTFFYELCRAQNLQPDDPWGSCSERWREAVDGTITRVAGDYHYVARWSDGTTRRGRLRIGDDQDGQTITLARP